MALIEKLKKHDDMTECEKDICKYILKHPDKICEMSSRELGNETYTSAASITRFCQKLGVKGFPEFKLKLIGELKNGVIDEEEETISVAEHENAVTMLRKITKIQHQAIENTKKELSYSQLVKAGRMIAEAKQIDFYAYDVNEYLAQYGRTLFFYAGKQANIYNTANIQALRALMPPDGNMAILISHTGENRKLIEIAKLLRKQGTKIIVMTAGRDRTLASYADECLCMPISKRVDEFWNSMFFESGKYILDILFGMEFSSRYEENQKLNEQYEKNGRAYLWGLEKDV